MNDPFQKQGRQRSRRYRKRVLAVRAMAGETGWLDGTPLWIDGRATWETEHGSTAPTVATIALAQRRLGQIGATPRASGQVLGDVPGWLRRRLDTLQVAKELVALHVPDVALLCSSASLRQAGDREIRALIDLLLAEAYCLNELPSSPARALYTCSAKAARPLIGFATDPDKPSVSRALAALVLGALRKTGASEIDLPQQDEDWVNRAFTFGMANGLPQQPALYVALLGDAKGTAAGEMLEISTQTWEYLPPPEALRRLLHNGTPAAVVIELCRLCSEIAPLVEHISNYRHELPEKPAHLRAARADELRHERANTAADLISILHRYMLGQASPTALRSALRLASYFVYAKEHYYTPLGEAAIHMLTTGLALPPELQPQFLDLIYQRRDFIWADLDRKAPKFLKPWMGERQKYEVEPIASALRAVDDPETVLQALKIGNIYILLGNKYRDPAMYRYVMSVMEVLGVEDGMWSFMTALESLNFAGAKDAKQVLAPLIRAVVNTPSGTNADLLGHFMDALRASPSDMPGKIKRWAGYVPYMEPFLGNQPRAMVYQVCVIAVAMDQTLGERGPDWFRSLTSALERAIGPEPGNRIYYIASALRLTGPLGLVLSPTDQVLFQQIALIALTHSFSHSIVQIDAAIDILKGLPSLCAALAPAFPLYPSRCMELAFKIGLAAKLGKEALVPLSYLEESSIEEVPLPAEWRALLDMAPGTERAVRSYLLAQRLRGAGTAIPPGVRKAWEQPTRMEQELAFLEKKVADSPGNAGLATRRDNLRTRLTQRSRLLESAREEIAERLAHAEAEAHLACAEAKVLESYKARLATLAGYLPPDLMFDDNLANATLLLSEIRDNRKMLIRLLRAYVRGHSNPYAEHPDNVQFLAKLASSGVDADVWLSANPRRYACAGVTGGKVRLVLETDPLGVLQMGNYFDTCLSFGGINAFSTVANACEANKRVIYAYDGAGRVVARKLIGINEEGKLIGFNTYTTLGGKAADAVRDVFERYCAAFASKCGLDMGDTGTVPRLFAERWYDDGAVSWTGPDEQFRHVGSPVSSS